MDRRSLDVPASLSGIDPIVREIDDALIELWGRTSTENRQYLRRIQTSIPTLIRLFTERMRTSPASPQEVRFWQRVHGAPGGHLIWVGMGKPEPQCDWTTDGRTRRTTPARVAWLLLRGQDVPPDQHLRRTCDRDRCIAPDCQTLSSDYASRPSMKRIRKDVLSDGTGGYIHARCGNPLSRLPRPGRRVYCPACYQEDQRLLKAAEAARLAQLYPRSQTAYTPPAPVLADMPRAQEPVMLPQPTKTPVITQDIHDAARALFDDE